MSNKTGSSVDFKNNTSVEYVITAMMANPGVQYCVTCHNNDDIDKVISFAGKQNIASANVDKAKTLSMLMDYRKQMNNTLQTDKSVSIKLCYSPLRPK